MKIKINDKGFISESAADLKTIGGCVKEFKRLRKRGGKFGLEDSMARDELANILDKTYASAIKAIAKFDFSMYAIEDMEQKVTPRLEKQREEMLVSLKATVTSFLKICQKQKINRNMLLDLLSDGEYSSLF